MPTDLLQGNLAPLKKHATWFILFGILITLLGIVCLGMTVTLTLTSMMYFGLLLLVRGAFELLASFRSRDWGGFFFHLISASIGAVAGLVMVTRPGMAAETITLFLGALFMVEGMMLLFAGLIYRFPSWGWTLANGLITFVLGLMLWQEFPFSGLYFIGTLIAIEILMTGANYIALGLYGRRLARQLSLS
ncbi:HdeD family acid-resistance protein [bacterium]|nr:HdeD family acid-resistance protein [bacterium]